VIKMNKEKLKLRTKIEASVILLLMLVVSVSATVTITDVSITTSDSSLIIDFDDNWISANNASFENATIGDILTLTPTTEPTSPIEGTIFCNSTDHHMYFYNGTMWVLLSVTVNAGTAVGVYNGSWIAHGLPGDPHINGSITLSLRCSTTYNATTILRAPTVLQSNTTHFQIEFTAWETVGWTQIPVRVDMAQTVYWDAVYRGI